jgi:transglutaminase-like putative cysteine protease
MSQKIKDGIVIDNTVYMMDEKKTGFPVLMRCLQFLTVILGSFSAISILTNCFDLPVIQKYISLAVLISGILIFTMILYPSYDWIKLAVSIVIYLIILRKYFHQLQNGFYLLENSILNRAGGYYGMTVIPYKARYSSAETDITLLMIMILIPLVALLAYAIIRSRLLSVCDIVLLLPVATSFAMGVTPTEASLLTYILVMIYMTRSYGAGQASYKEQKFMLHRIHNRSALVLCLVILGLFQIMKFVVPEEKYETMEGIKEAKVDIQDFLFNFSWEDFTDRINEIEWLPSRKGGSGGLNSGKLGRVDQVNYDESEQLQLTAPLKSISDGIYLKGFVGTNYTGDSWEEHTKEEKQQYKELEKKLPSTNYDPANISTEFVKQLTSFSSIKLMNSMNNVGQPNAFEFSKGTIRIRYNGANKNYLYAPYLTDFDSAEASEYRSDLYAAPLSKKDSYEFDYYYNLNMGDNFSDYLKAADINLASYTEFEKLYRDYVYDVYTKLPATGLDRLRSDFTREKVGSRADSIDKAVSYVKDYLQSNAQYTLSPGKLPKGKDFVEYFIYENKVGYCSHFASAGVLMLRALGYPARYVEGYAVNSSDIQYDEGISDGKTTIYSDQYSSIGYDSMVEVSVKDYCAHAWAEVYIDGCGWFPVEFTPSASIENTESVIEDMADAGQGITKEAEAQVTPTPTVTPKPTEAPKDEDKVTPTVTPIPKDDQTGGDNNTGTKSRDQGMKRFLGGLLFFALAAAAVLILTMLVLHFFRKRRLELMDNRSRRAIYCYKGIERLLRLNKALPKKGRSLEDYLDQVSEQCSYIDGKEFETCMETVRKARFGRNTISEEELLVVEHFYDSLLRKVLNGASPVKRTYLKMILSI